MITKRLPIMQWKMEGGGRHPVIGKTPFGYLGRQRSAFAVLSSIRTGIYRGGFSSGQDDTPIKDLPLFGTPP